MKLENSRGMRELNFWIALELVSQNDSKLRD